MPATPAEAQRFAAPKNVSEVDLAFGGLMRELLPPRSAIPDEFDSDANPWCKWQADWFFGGLKRYPAPKPGIDVRAAMRHLGAIQRSWEPKHEHKMAAVAYLASLWFESPNGREANPQ